MKAYEFPANVTDEGKIKLPNAVLQQLANNQQVKVIILVNESTEEEAAWYRLAAEQLLKGYSEDDVIYDMI
ncbi:MULTISPECIES: hypothetical protein [unclassified Tolypothrix]|uniref:hypothetical protein n=1 Tax=unclassified Tolypothrix TaxID=2649714 RepID=UPI0005EAA281|nr:MULTISPECIES: hypothetical protein [unclassified Tolypothrix]BAY91668.1 hypothetical protein NIES3275_36930 [Microchaete diplosiphon NIES-3275]EKF05211.1 hypothetical protein FDUTEX481_01381 [Tolypothrix sp. PCC 7601]MBE9085834.1 hypothetical protein [Tolypothrix sp. LEGE 11397]UYD25685.1 hypothetical protein HGR01_30835 [Tolypothrix sp. PCC 7712]UYD32075.1 hypothetical protein HG267_23705 [Tolypothrix sp. PCC 7601]